MPGHTIVAIAEWGNRSRSVGKLAVRADRSVVAYTDGGDHWNEYQPTRPQAAELVRLWRRMGLSLRRVSLHAERVCKNCGRPAGEHSTFNICPRFVRPGQEIDAAPADTTWWEPVDG